MTRTKEAATIIDKKFLKRYKTDPKVRTASGGRSVSNGDAVAKALNGLDEAQLAKVASAVGLSERWHAWKELNAGMQRMNLSNVMRAALRHDDTKEKAQAALKTAAGMPRAGSRPKKG